MTVKMPDPVGANMYVLNEVGELTLAGFTVDQMEAYANSRVREALEEALQAVRDLEKQLIDSESFASAPQVASFAANRILALLNQERK